MYDCLTVTDAPHKLQILSSHIFVRCFAAVALFPQHLGASAVWPSSIVCFLLYLSSVNTDVPVIQSSLLACVDMTTVHSNKIKILKVHAKCNRPAGPTKTALKSFS